MNVIVTLPNALLWALSKGTHQNSSFDSPPNRRLDTILEKGIDPNFTPGLRAYGYAVDGGFHG
jgi:hypothetical protein